MSKRVDIAGASGQSYSFLPLDGEGPLRPIGVTYLVAEKLGQGWRVLQVGETNNLAQRDWQPRSRPLVATIQAPSCSSGSTSAAPSARLRRRTSPRRSDGIS